jgi:hypothetical protein
MNELSLKARLKKQIKSWIINSVIKQCNNSRLSEKSLGIIIRTFHMCAPINFITTLLFAPHLLCVITMSFLVFVTIMFYTFDFCFLTLIEQKFCNDNFTILDPHLELLNMEINNDNRFYISNINGIIYMVIICIIYYIRFLQ